MSEEKTGIFRQLKLGFAQFRLVVATILLLAAGLKAHQLAAAPLPPVVRENIFTPLLELLNDRYFQMFVVVGEILFALVLIADIWRSWAWLLSLFGFSAFTLVSVMKGLSGESSCGCFGVVMVNPWATAGFDLVIVALLVVFRERLDWTFPHVNHKKLLVVLSAWLVFAGTTLFAMLSLKQQPHATLGSEFTGSNGKKMILLEPETWIGKEFPLFSRFVQSEGSEALKQGTWNVLFAQPDCPKCRELKAELEAKKAERIALVVIPSRPNEKIPDTSFPTFWLDRQNDWFVTTPCVVKLTDGICIATGENVIE